MVDRYRTGDSWGLEETMHGRLEENTHGKLIKNTHGGPIKITPGHGGTSRACFYPGEKIFSLIK